MSDFLLHPLGWSYVAALLGLLFGSFLNVCISRLPDDYSVVIPRSHCPQCGTTIAWYDNVPLLSYVLLGGKCRACSRAIALRYPAVEALTAILFYTAVSTHGATWAGVKWCIFAAWLVALIFTDIETRILPDEFTKSGWVLGMMLAPIVPLPPGISLIFFSQLDPAGASFAEAAAASIILPLFLWWMAVVYKKVRGIDGLGFGDVKMLAFLGAFLGIEGTLLVLVLASLMGSVLGLIWIKMRGEDTSTYELPFGSFLGIAGLIVAFAGAKLLTWYPGG